MLNEDGSVFALLPKCGRADMTLPELQDDLPADYDVRSPLITFYFTFTCANLHLVRLVQGWLEYAAFKETSSFESFLSTFSVPDTPAQVVRDLPQLFNCRYYVCLLLKRCVVCIVQPAVLYLFPGCVPMQLHNY